MNQGYTLCACGRIAAILPDEAQGRFYCAHCSEHFSPPPPSLARWWRVTWMGLPDHPADILAHRRSLAVRICQRLVRAAAYPENWTQYRARRLASSQSPVVVTSCAA